MGLVQLVNFLVVKYGSWGSNPALLILKTNRCLDYVNLLHFESNCGETVSVQAMLMVTNAYVSCKVSQVKMVGVD